MNFLIIKVIIGFLTLSLLQQSCIDCDPKPVNYPQDMVFAIYPEKRTYRVGDTLNFFTYTQENIFPTGFDINSDEIASQISVYQYFNYFSDSVYAVKAAKKFDSFIIHGERYPDQLDLVDVNILGYRYVFIDSIYLAEIGIILRDTGAFTFTPFAGGIKTELNQKCETFGIFPVYYQNDNCNWALLDSLNNTYTPPEYWRNRYTFIVEPN
ncbi:MAG: hypothetical protein ABIV51_03815 [Saprospiraceae bacterium]